MVSDKIINIGMYKDGTDTLMSEGFWIFKVKVILVMDDSTTGIFNSSSYLEFSLFTIP